jgi:hypothetical protein
MSDIIDPSALATMRERGGTWAAYRNEDLGHSQVGHLQFLKVGMDCTYAAAPEQHPQNWRYRLVGMVDLGAGTIK